VACENGSYSARGFLYSARILKLACIIVFCLALAQLFLSIPSVRLAHIQPVNDGMQKISLNSYPKTSSLKESLWNIEYRHNQLTKFNFVPQGCVEYISVSGIDITRELLNLSRCDWRNGFFLDLEKHLKVGLNELRLRLKDSHGNGEIQIAAKVWETAKMKIGILVMGLSSLAFILPFFSWLGLNKSSCLFSLLSIALICFVAIYTGPYRFDNDTVSTVTYIQYLFQKRQLPGYYEIFLGFHPPLYYVLSALVYALAFEIWPGEPLDVVRWFSLGCFSIFLIFSCLLIQRLVTHKYSQIIALALFTSWPLGCFISGRLNNEILMYCFAAIALNFLWTWLITSNQRTFIYGCIAIALACCSKASALSLWAIVVSIFVWKLSSKEYRRSLFHKPLIYLITVCCCIALSIANLGRGWSENYTRSQSLPLLIGNKLSANVPHVMVNNSAAHLFTFNLKYFLTAPYYDISSDLSGRQYFLNSYFKSALFGSFSFSPQILPIISAVVFLCLIVFTFGDTIAQLWIKRFLAVEDFFITIVITTFFLASFFIRLYTDGNAVSQEFRYGYPCITLFCAGVGRLSQRYNHSRTITTIISTLVMSLIVSSLGVVFSL
jgi:hypothetical protein